MWRFDIGGGGKESEHREPEPCECEDDQHDDSTEKNLAHEASGCILADQRGAALVADGERSIHSSFARTDSRGRLSPHNVFLPASRKEFQYAFRRRASRTTSSTFGR